jgi:hypothetical protein
MHGACRLSTALRAHADPTQTAACPADLCVSVQGWAQKVNLDKMRTTAGGPPVTHMPVRTAVCIGP